MQYVSGVNLFIFWGASILWDILANIITIIIIIVMLALSQRSEWKTFSDLSVLFVILLFYNIAMIPLICLVSLIFSKPTLGKTLLIIFNLVAGECRIDFSTVTYIVVKLITGHFFFSHFSTLVPFAYMAYWTLKINSIVAELGKNYGSTLGKSHTTLDVTGDFMIFPLWPYPLCTMIDALYTLKLRSINEPAFCKLYYRI